MGGERDGEERAEDGFGFERGLCDFADNDAEGGLFADLDGNDTAGRQYLVRAIGENTTLSPKNDIRGNFVVGHLDFLAGFLSSSWRASASVIFLGSVSLAILTKLRLPGPLI